MKKVQIPETVKVVVYKDPKAFNKDAVELAKMGWEVSLVTDQQRRSGCMRIFLLGPLFAMVFKPKQTLVVTYKRAIK